VALISMRFIMLFLLSCAWQAAEVPQRWWTIDVQKSRATKIRQRL